MKNFTTEFYNKTITEFKYSWLETSEIFVYLLDFINFY